MEGDEIYQAFEAYSFEQDQKYQSGAQSLGGDSLKARHFYYSKFETPFDINKYIEWQQTSKNTDELLAENALNYKKLNVHNHEKPVVIELGEKVENGLSFQEIIAKVQKGEQIAGIKEIDLQVHSLGSKSSAQPRKKPWET
jgi:hypothetical protein